MARITVKSRNRIDVRLSTKEFNALTIGLALLNIPDMEREMEEQGLDRDQVEYDHLTLFKAFTDVNGLYPQAKLPDDLSANISPMLEDEKV